MLDRILNTNLLSGPWSEYFGNRYTGLGFAKMSPKILGAKKNYKSVNGLNPLNASVALI